MRFIVLVLIFSFIIQVHVKAQNEMLFDYNGGLSSSLITQIIQDEMGFIWVATEYGLNRFDGITFSHFSENQNNEYALSNNFVTALAHDREGKLWVGQVNGLQYFDPKTENFHTVKIDLTDHNIQHFVSSVMVKSNGDIWVTTSNYGVMIIEERTGRSRYLTELNDKLSSKNIRCIFEDRDGTIWIGTDNSGLNVYDSRTNKVEIYSETAPPGKRLPSNNIRCISEGENGTIYIGSMTGGLTGINKKNGTVKTIQSSDAKEPTLPVMNILFDSKEQLWIGTDGYGLKTLNTQTGKLDSYLADSPSFDFTKSKIHSLIEDKNGNIWAGIFQKGLHLVSQKPAIFNYYGYNPLKNKSIGSNCITAIEGDLNTLWVSTDGDGLYKINRRSGETNHILPRNENDVPEGKNIISLHNTKGDYLWIGTYMNGLIRYDKRKGTTKIYKNNPNDPHSLVNDNVLSITEDENGKLWLGTLGGGICYYNAEDEKFHVGFENHDEFNINIPTYINHIYIDKNQNFWLGTYVGLVFYNPKNKRFHHFSKSENTLLNNTVVCINSDKKGNVWVGTHGGLVKINPETFETKYYNNENGLSNNIVCAIAEDEFGQLWISTHFGLTRFNPDDETFTNFFLADGIQSNEFSRNSFFVSEGNELFFGGINGITEVRRDYKSYRLPLKDVMLTDFKLFNKPVSIGQKTGRHIILNKSIAMADTVKLKETDNFFSIGFTSDALAVQSRISYQYRMKGFDDNWINTNSMNRQATFTNIKQGNYIFEVQAVHKDQFSSVRQLYIIVYPPWYKTLTAKAFWSLLFIVFILGLFLFFREKDRRKQLEKLNEMKMQFFINISHELKTPLTLIIDPIEKLLADANPKNRKIYLIIHQNANRIFRLINQIMDVRKIDNNKLMVKFQETNLQRFITEIAQSFEILAKSKNISFSIDSDEEETIVWVDPLNFDKVINNLLSNAFKFTPSGGNVSVEISNLKSENKRGKVKIDFIDSGIGIPKKDIDRIFDRFYQVQTNEDGLSGGTGIGLHLSRQLVEIHQGTLSVSDRKDSQGSVFTIILTLGFEHLPKKDLIIKENHLPTTTSNTILDYLPESESVNFASFHPKTNYKVMVVDDEYEIRNYLSSVLSEFYRIVVCKNGKEAFNILFEEKPDLIVTDIMMPEMDGISFCKKVKSNPKTSHIPIILLTALSSYEKRLEGIETGADLYLAKPFNSKLLQTSIASILENRRKLLLQIRKEKGYYNIENIKMKSHDEIIMQKVMTIIKDNISDEKLNVEMLAEGVGISRVHMHRKLKEITNQSARDFIKDIRMKQASYLLANKKVNVSEVAYAVGYSSLSHFSNTFKSFYGVSPTEFAGNTNLNQSLT